MIDGEFTQLIVDVVAIFDALYFMSVSSLNEQQLAHYSDARHSALLALAEVHVAGLTVRSRALRIRLRAITPKIARIRGELDHSPDAIATLKAARKGRRTLEEVALLLRK